MKISLGEGGVNVLTSTRRKRFIYFYRHTHTEMKTVWTNTEQWLGFGMIFQESHPKKWVLIKIIPLHHTQNTAISPVLKNF